MITVVWPQEVLDRVGIVQPLTFGELINAEGLQLTPSQINAFEAGPQFQGTIPGIVGIITQVRGDGKGGTSGPWGEHEGRGGTSGPWAEHEGRGGTSGPWAEHEGRGGMTSSAGESESVRDLPTQRPPEGGEGPY